MNSLTIGKEPNLQKDLKKYDLWTNMNAVKKYKVLDDYRIWLQFEDGFEGIVEVKPLLKKGIALELLDPDTFRKLVIESGGGLAWENGFDICPNTLREFTQEKVPLV